MAAIYIIATSILPMLPEEVLSWPHSHLHDGHPVMVSRKTVVGTWVGGGRSEQEAFLQLTPAV